MLLLTPIIRAHDLVQQYVQSAKSQLAELKQAVVFKEIRVGERFYDPGTNQILLKTDSAVATFETGDRASKEGSSWFRPDAVVSRSLLEVIVPLRDGWSLRSTRRELEGGEFARLCDPSEHAVDWWFASQWQGRPIEMVGDFILAAAGHRRGANPEPISNEANDIVAWLEDGCSIRTGREQPGAFVRVCEPDGADYLCFKAQDWVDDPTNIMGPLLAAASGLRTEPVESVDDAADTPSMGG